MYPYVSDRDYPDVKYAKDRNGNWLVLFYDQSKEGQVACVAIEADVLLKIAFKMCVDHVDTEWATRHLESKGYRVTKRAPDTYGALAPLVSLIERMKAT